MYFDVVVSMHVRLAAIRESGFPYLYVCRPGSHFGKEKKGKKNSSDINWN